MKKIFSCGLLSLLLSLLLVTSAEAALKGALSIESKKIKEEDKHITVACKAEAAGNITNGKLRITYDPQKLTLEESKAGEGLADTMVQINDPVTGNKQEGEIVLVFAGAQPVSIDGTLLEMNFVNKGLKNGESTKIQLEVEEFASEDEELKEGTTTENGTISVGDASVATEDKDKQKENENKGKVSKSSSVSKTGKVKTGDETQILKMAGIAAGSFTVVILSVIIAKKRKKNT